MSNKYKSHLGLDQLYGKTHSTTSREISKRLDYAINTSIAYRSTKLFYNKAIEKVDKFIVIKKLISWILVSRVHKKLGGKSFGRAEHLYGRNYGAWLVLR